jgi:hypothetical protein
MGQEQYKLGRENIENNQNIRISRNDFIFEDVIGRGGFGKVCYNNK